MADEPLLEGVPIQCHNCHDDIPDGEDREYQGYKYCQECLDELTAPCDRCSDWVAVNELEKVVTRRNRRRETQRWCEDCRYNYAFSCDRCEVSYDRNNFEYYTTAHDAQICSGCYESSFFTCSGCDGIFHNDHIHESRDQYYCSSCYDNLDDDDDEEGDDSGGGLVHDYDYKPRPIFYGHEKSLYLGVELEVNCRRGAIEWFAGQTLGLLNPKVGIEDHVYLKQDSSISSGGFEIVTHPHTLAEQWKLWERFFAKVPKGMSSYDKGECGMHVHVGKKQLTPLQISKATVFINKPSNKAFCVSVAQREAPDFAQYKEKRMATVLNEGDHYDALNVGPTRTIEFRLFRGTVRGDRFFKNLEFVVALLMWVNTVTGNQLQHQNFIEWVNKNRGQYPVLHAFLVEKKWCVQPKRAPNAPPVTYTTSEEVHA